MPICSSKFLLFSTTILGASVLFSILCFLFSGGIVSAASVTISASIPSVCGNDRLDTGEEGDTSQLGNQSCASRGFSGGGTLNCEVDCTFDTSQCIVGSSGSGNSSGGGGGGGGGGGYFASPTQVVFYGRAYPSSEVTLLKDAQVQASTVAGSDASFQITISNLSAGNYIFSLYGEDKNGARSSLLTFPVSVTEGITTNVSGIFIAPTISVDKSEVKKGDSIALFGQSAPAGQITIGVSSNEFFVKTMADANGIYLYNLDTSELEMGQHFAKSKSSVASEISSHSQAVAFTVGNKTVFAPKRSSNPNLKGDSNKDSKVNLVDFSIMAYWYKRSTPPVNVDLNNDKKVDLIDFSILAFYWTG